MKKPTSMLTTAIAGFVAIMIIAGDHVGFANDATHGSISMLQMNLPYFLILMVGAGAIGSITFLFIISAEVMRRRRKKYSCIQH